MNQNFKLKYDQLKEGDPTKDAQDNSYVRESNARNVCFVLSEGKMKAMNYSYLVSIEYDETKGEIVLSFTSDIVTLAGVHLKELFFEFMEHRPRIVEAKEERYNSLEETEKPLINKIRISAADE
jgi:hypothetical protein